MGTVFVKLYLMVTKLVCGSRQAGVEVAWKEKGGEVVDTFVSLFVRPCGGVQLTPILSIKKSNFSCNRKRSFAVID
jgi:hypothetical protein